MNMLRSRVILMSTWRRFSPLVWNALGNSFRNAKNKPSQLKANYHQIKRCYHHLRQIGTSSCISGATLSLIGVVHAGWGLGGGSKEEKKAEGTGNISAEEKILRESDDLYDQYKIPELYSLLVAHKDSQNDDILWRLARAAREKALMTKDKKEADSLLYDALSYVEKALELNQNNFASHKWRAILLDLVGEIEGNKKRIENAFVCKEHFKKAIELNPKDATTIHCLGVWCFTIADMGWVKRKLASTVYATPPESNYEEALQYFLDAEKADPQFYSMNLLMIGKTYYRMNKKDLATEYLKKARAYPIVTADDEKAHKESIELLKALGVKE